MSLETRKKQTKCGKRAIFHQGSPKFGILSPLLTLLTDSLLCIPLVVRNFLTMLEFSNLWHFQALSLKKILSPVSGVKR